MPKRIVVFLAFLAMILGLASTPALSAPVPPGSGVVPSISPPPFLPDGTIARKDTAKIPNTRMAGVNVKKAAPPSKMTRQKPVASRSALLGTPTYYYAGRNQGHTAPNKPYGAYANLRVNNTFLAATDYHSLAEIAVQDGPSNEQIVEVIVTKDPVVCGFSDPCLAGFHWINGQGTCYNCNFIDYGANPVNLGANVSSWVGTAKQIGIQYFNGNWWLSAGGGWIGYYEGTRWSSPPPGYGSGVSFVDSNFTQFFGEVVVDVPGSQNSDMGSGTHGNTGALPAAYFGSVAYLGGPGSSPTLSNVVTDATRYSVGVASARTFYFGGPGLGGNIGS
jgi:hypothetical protein